MANQQWNPSTGIPNLKDKVAIVTGGSTGIGYETVKALAQGGAKVYMTTRNQTRARQAKEKITEDPDIDPNNVQYLVMDLYDPTSITAAVDELKNKENKVHILINNAGAGTPSTELVDGKYEQHMAANHMGPFLLVNRLFPLLQAAASEKGADVRIINIGSIAHIKMLPGHFEFKFDSPTCFKDPVPWYPWQWRFFGTFMFKFDMIRYAVSKAAVVLFTQELQRRFDAQDLPIICIAVDPGTVRTEGLLAISNIVVRTMAHLLFMTAEQGAANSLFAATAREVKEDAAKYQGKFLVPVGKLEVPNPVAQDDRQVKGLWENTTVEVNKWLTERKLPPLEADY